MKWFQIKEQSAGKKRLALTYYLYKILGKNALYFIAFLVSFFTFIFAKKVRNYSKKYLKVISDYTGIKPTIFNQFKHISSYANSLADKMLIYCGDFNSNDIIFDNKDDEEQMFIDINKKQGAFFICNHIGNIQVLQSFFLNKEKRPDFGINVFLSTSQSKIFNDFLKTIGIDYPLKTFLIEEMGIDTGVQLKENLNNGDIVFIAGDRLSENNDTRNIKGKMYNKNIFLPEGTFKLAKLMDVPTYFISAIKDKNKYRVVVERQDDLSEKNLADSFIKYMERAIKINPFQFFHFYDFFN